VRLAELMITLSPMTMRSNGFSSTLKGIGGAPLWETARGVSGFGRRLLPRPEMKRERGGGLPRRPRG
jgi:hypothetical protein